VGVKEATFCVSGEADGDVNVMSFIENCHPEFYKQRTEDTNTNFGLEVTVSVKLVDFDEDDE
jgi:hypothetical protein